MTPVPHFPSVLLRIPGGSVGAVLVGLALVVLVVLGGGGADVVVGGGGALVVLVVGGGRETIVVEMTTGGATVVERVVGTGMDVEVTFDAGRPGWPGTPKQAPNWDWQPAPQKSREEPHQKNCEQQGP